MEKLTYYENSSEILKREKLLLRMISTYLSLSLFNLSLQILEQCDALLAEINWFVDEGLTHAFVGLFDSLKLLLVYRVSWVRMAHFLYFEVFKVRNKLLHFFYENIYFVSYQCDFILRIFPLCYWACQGSMCRCSSVLILILSLPKIVQFLTFLLVFFHEPLEMFLQLLEPLLLMVLLLTSRIPKSTEFLAKLA